MLRRERQLHRPRRDAAISSSFFLQRCYRSPRSYRVAYIVSWRAPFLLRQRRIFSTSSDVSIDYPTAASTLPHSVHPGLLHMLAGRRPGQLIGSSLSAGRYRGSACDFKCAYLVALALRHCRASEQADLYLTMNELSSPAVPRYAFLLSLSVQAWYSECRHVLQTS